MPRADVVLAHQSLHTFFAGRKSERAQLPCHPGRTVGAFQLLVDGSDQGEHVRIGEALALRAPRALSSLVAAHVERLAHRVQSDTPCITRRSMRASQYILG